MNGHIDRATLVGLAAWLGYVAWSRPDPFGPAWPAVLVLFAANGLMPTALRLSRRLRDGDRALAREVAEAWQFPAALLLTAAFVAPVGPIATALALPYAALTIIAALGGAGNLLRRRPWTVATLCDDAARLNWSVAGLWALFDRAGATPFGFDATITLLTAVHFHYAGFILPIVSGLAVRELPTSRAARWAALGVVAGVPLTAVCMTATHWGFGPAWETVAASFMVASAFAAAGVLGVLSSDERRVHGARRAWSLAAATLFAGTMFAATYAGRFIAPSIAWDIPTMQAVHGSLNGFGFATCALLGWRLHCEPATAGRRTGRRLATIPE